MWSDNEAKEDLLGFQYLSDGIVSIVRNENLLPATLGVFGDWGGGKSTLIDMVKARLSTRADSRPLFNIPAIFFRSFFPS